MIVNYILLPYILAGIASIALLNTTGAVASRKFNFNVGLLSPVSFAIYTFIAYRVSKYYAIDIVVACNILIGMFEGLAGWNLLIKLKANTGQAEGQLIEISEGQRILMMAGIASFFAFVGYMIATNTGL